MSDTRDNQGDVIVHVHHVGELEKTTFKISEQSTLQALWDRAYAELGITRQERDILQARHGDQRADLQPYLALTVAQAREQGLLKGLQFEIVAGTGGA